MIITEFYYGQGLGNQLFVYVTTKSIALDRGYEFGYIGLENIGDRRYNNSGVYFMDLDLGIQVDMSKISNYYKEKEFRIKTNNSHHDATIGCDIRLYDDNLTKVPDNCKIDGVMQGEDYFYHRKNEIKEWLKIKPEYDCKDFSNEDTCVINFRDYRGASELYLEKDYWMNAINHMIKINPDMQFIVITESPSAASEMLPHLKDRIFHFDVGKDYSIINNAKWLILSNSSFAYFPAFTNTNVKLTIAPKYWARYNVSDGYWSCGYNLYRDFMYMDKKGNLQSYDDCLKEFEIYKKETKIYG
jgi:hypothetical protein